MKYRLSLGETTNQNFISLTGSKSESNRLLILQKLFGNFTIENLSDSKDTQVLQQALSTNSDRINIGHAGTAMRFLTAYFSIQEERKVVLEGSPRMHERPIAPLVEALQSLGADICYLNGKGYPPLEIKGKKLQGGIVEIESSWSSQYITALLLIAPALKKGLSLKLKGKITSKPYIDMSLQLLGRIGVEYTFEENNIHILPIVKNKLNTIWVESDWSSASYLYSFFALSKNQELNIEGLKKDSLQGDSKLQDIYRYFGVESSWEDEKLKLKKTESYISHLELDCTDFPDLAQTITVTAFALGISLQLTGLHTLKIKETDRLVALQNELRKLGAIIEIGPAYLSLVSRKKRIPSEICIATYEDHRMAMAFAPLAIKAPIYIENPQVVEKSFVNFWNVFQQLGGLINEKVE